jgi:ribose/xylose/arabinose/galactoside ABC-type transport system permease subunit
MHDGVVDRTRVVAPASDTPARAPAWRVLAANSRNLGLVVAIAIALTIVASQRPNYLSWDNLLVVLLQMAFVGIAALTMTGLIVGGNVDLSIGSLFGLSAVIATVVAKHASPPVAIVAGLFTGLAIGWINGLLVWRVRISPIIITLGGLTLLHGVVLLITNGYAITGVPPEFGGFGQAKVLGLPMPVALWAVLAVLAYVMLQRTTIGRHVFAIGGNREAAEAAGLRVRRIVLGSFAVNGLFVGLVGVLAASRYASADPSFGVGFELEVITAVILGGVAFAGGEGGIGGVLLAVCFLGVIDSGVVSLGIDPFYTDVIKGAVLIIAVAIDQFSHEQRERHQKRLAMRERQAEDRALAVEAADA